MQVPTLSYQHAINTIKLLYKHQGFKQNESTLSEKVYNEFNIDIKDAQLASLFAYIDEYIALLRILANFQLQSATQGLKPSGTYYKIIIRQIKHLTSIRLLCSHGLDTDARIILRLLFETGLTWTRFQLDDKFRQDYENVQTFKDSNAFWHTYLSKGKTETYIKEELTKRQSVWIGSMEDQIDHMKEILSSISHPSNIADDFSYKTDLENETFGVEKIPQQTHFTLHYSFLCTLMPLAIIPSPSEPLLANEEFKFKYEPEHETINDPLEYYQEIKKMFPALFLMFIKFSEETRKIGTNPTANMGIAASLNVDCTGLDSNQ
jgi:hypothetical protein